MDDERAVEDIATKFLLNTTRLRPQLSRPALEGAQHRIVKATINEEMDEEEADVISLITGSVAEFYIETMFPLVGDIDMMFFRSTQLAIPRGHPPPTQLPAEFHNYVRVFEIIDSHLPGYVYLAIRYLLTECDDNGKYNAIEYEHDLELYLTVLSFPTAESHIQGPALVHFQPGSIAGLSCDNVFCLRCIVWPPQAANWPTRHRNYDWPDSTTVDRVVNNGCDVVGVAHRQCRQDEWMRQHQWRLSFSRAEIVLINSWMPVQQIVYHVLRVFMKTEILRDSDNNTRTGSLSNYHIKTLMLWACELKPRIWWTDHFSLIGICVELLHDLALWLTEARCPHYFIANCNLVDSSCDLEIIRQRLTSISTPCLLSWFVQKYLGRCSELCPRSVSRLFDDISTTTKLQNAISAIVDWRLNTTLHAMFRVLDNATAFIVSMVSFHSLTVRSLACWLTELRKISTILYIYFLSVAFLHVACRTQRNGLNDELMDVLAVLVGQSIDPRRYSSQHSSVLLLSKAVNLMKAVDDRSTSRSTVQLIEIELSKAYLYRALSCEDSDSDSIYCLANVYLAVLYCTTRQCQTAIDHCTLVMRSQDHSQCSSHVVQGELLPKTDDEVDTVLGLAVFYQHVRMAALNQQQQPQHVTVFTTELFAHYLHMKCLSITKCQQLSDTTNSQSSTCELQSYLKCLTEAQQLFVADALLWKLITCVSGKTLVYKQDFDSRQCRVKYPCELNTSDLIQLLQQYAVEHLTAFLQIQARDFDSLATTVTTEFEALYAYKHGDYQQCLQLSTQNVRRLLHGNALCVTSFAFPEFIQLLDDDIVSLIALTVVRPESRLGHYGNVGITQLSLSLYLMTQCQLKLRHSVMSLAQTLDYIKDAYRRYPDRLTLDRLILKMIARKTITSIQERSDVLVATTVQEGQTQPTFLRPIPISSSSSVGSLILPSPPFLTIPVRSPPPQRSGRQDQLGGLWSIVNIPSGIRSGAF